MTTTTATFCVDCHEPIPYPRVTLVRKGHRLPLCWECITARYQQSAPPAPRPGVIPDDVARVGE